MVQQTEQFKDAISGKIFDTYEDARISEQRSLDIQTAFNFYEPVNDMDCKFGNGEWCIQHTEEFYNRLLDTLIEMINKHEPWIAEQFRKNGNSLSRDMVKGQSIIGRYLDDGDSDLYQWYCIQGNICPICFKEYGQMFYALNCKHDNSIPITN